MWDGFRKFLQKVSKWAPSLIVEGVYNRQRRNQKRKSWTRTWGEWWVQGVLERVRCPRWGQGWEQVSLEKHAGARLPKIQMRLEIYFTSINDIELSSTLNLSHCYLDHIILGVKIETQRVMRNLEIDAQVESPAVYCESQKSAMQLLVVHRGDTMLPIFSFRSLTQALTVLQAQTCNMYQIFFLF